jgi:hypothetical protein
MSLAYRGTRRRLIRFLALQNKKLKGLWSHSEVVKTAAGNNSKAAEIIEFERRREFEKATR